jgi:hypothetical protein
VRRKTNQGFAPDNLTRGRRREILLAEMDAVGVTQSGEVGPVVDDDHGAERPRERHDRRRGVEQPRARGLLGPDLQETGAAVEERVGQVEERPSDACGDVSVQDGVQSRD